MATAERTAKVVVVWDIETVPPIVDVNLATDPEGTFFKERMESLARSKGQIDSFHLFSSTSDKIGHQKQIQGIVAQGTPVTLSKSKGDNLGFLLEVVSKSGLQCKASGDRLTLIIATNNESFTAALDLLSSSTRFSEIVLVCDAHAPSSLKSSIATCILRNDLLQGNIKSSVSKLQEARPRSLIIPNKRFGSLYESPAVIGHGKSSAVSPPPGGLGSPWIVGRGLSRDDGWFSRRAVSPLTTGRGSPTSGEETSSYSCESSTEETEAEETEAEDERTDDEESREIPIRAFQGRQTSTQPFVLQSGSSGQRNERNSAVLYYHLMEYCKREKIMPREGLLKPKLEAFLLQSNMQTKPLTARERREARSWCKINIQLQLDFDQWVDILKASGEVKIQVALNGQRVLWPSTGTFSCANYYTPTNRLNLKEEGEVMGFLAARLSRMKEKPRFSRLHTSNSQKTFAKGFAGRHGFALHMKESGPSFLRRWPLGYVVEMVQVLVNRKILRFRKGIVDIDEGVIRMHQNFKPAIQANSRFGADDVNHGTSLFSSPFPGDSFNNTFKSIAFSTTVHEAAPSARIFRPTPLRIVSNQPKLALTNQFYLPTEELSQLVRELCLPAAEKADDSKKLAGCCHFDKSGNLHQPEWIATIVLPQIIADCNRGKLSRSSICRCSNSEGCNCIVFMSGLKSRKQDAKEEAADRALAWVKENYSMLKRMLQDRKAAPQTAKTCPVTVLDWNLDSLAKSGQAAASNLVYTFAQHKSSNKKPGSKFGVNQAKPRAQRCFHVVSRRVWTCTVEIRDPSGFSKEFKSFAAAADSMIEAKIQVARNVLSVLKLV